MKIVKANYDNQDHHQIIRDLMNHYAQDPMGGGEPLAKEALDNLVSGLKAFGKATTFLAYDNDKAIGLINCILGFSTFKAKTLMNIHDVIVKDGYRGKGVTQVMLKAAEEFAVELGCCKLTLEVLEGNAPAIRAYKKYGFDGYELDPKMGKAMFWEKKL